jgi:D-alanyl-D-alanine carboxypeptidase
MDKLFPDGKYKALANYKGANHWDKITVEMLLNHTSGMIDYLNVYGDDATAMKKLAVKGKTYTPDDLVQLAISHGDANFEPGARFKYCNTGYILLGEIITKKSGMNWRDYIEQNIVKPAGMTDTWFGSRLSPEALKRRMVPHCDRKVSFMPPTLAGAAGEIVSNLADLRKFLHAWQSGKLYQKPETLEMQRTKGFHKMGDPEGLLEYGYGVMKIKGFYGHGGQTFGFQSYVAMNPEAKRLCIVGVNDASVPAMVLFREVEHIK